MNSDPIDRGTLLTRLAAAFAALPALAMKGHAAATGSPPSGAAGLAAGDGPVLALPISRNGDIPIRPAT